MKEWIGGWLAALAYHANWWVWVILMLVVALMMAWALAQPTP